MYLLFPLVLFFPAVLDSSDAIHETLYKEILVLHESLRLLISLSFSLLSPRFLSQRQLTIINYVKKPEIKQNCLLRHCFIFFILLSLFDKKAINRGLLHDLNAFCTEDGRGQFLVPDKIIQQSQISQLNNLV